MKTPLQITSPSNQTIKDLVRLKERKGERADGFFAVEGFREIQRAVKSGYKLEELYFCRDHLHQESADLIEKNRGVKLAELSKQAFAKIATRDGTDGLLAVFATQSVNVESILERAKGQDLFLLVLEKVEKPGNLGAILRTADAFGVHGVILLESKVDLWNSNVIRSSLGGVFAVPVVGLRFDEFLKFCRHHKLKTVAAALTSRSVSLIKTDLKGPIALVLGSEAEGISAEVLDAADQLVIIPMLGICDSLNVSVAAGICAFEALRQRAKT